MQQSLDRITAPASIGFVGASANPTKMGTMQLLNLRHSGFPGRILPVHPQETEIFGLRAYARIEDLPEAPDMFMLVVPTRLVPEMVAAFGRLGTRCGVIVTAGFKESGEAGIDLEARLAETARTYDIRFLGPNCMGVVNTRHPLNLTAAPFGGRPGGLSLISQSGTYITQTLGYLAARGIGLNQALSVGNEATIDLVDCLAHLGQDPATRAIGLYIECIRRPAQFLETARRIRRRKPIVAQYVGGTAAGARSGASHTGALAGPDDLYDGLLDQAGVLRVHTVEALYQVGHTLASQPPPRGRGIAVLTNSGGPGTAMASALDTEGLEVPELGETVQSALRAHMPGHASVRNPVDLTFHTDMSQLSRTLPAILMAADEIDGLLIHGIMDTGWTEMVYPVFERFFGADRQDFRKLLNVQLDDLVGMPARYGKPLLVSSFFGREDEALRTFHDHGIPTFDSPEKAARAMAALWRWGQIRQRPDPRPADRPPPAGIAELLAAGPPDEYTAKRILAACGIPIVREARVTTAAEAASAAAEIGYPVVLKACSAEIAHKTEAGLVHLHLADDRAVAAAARAVQRRAPGAAMLVGEMLDARREVIAGITRPEGFPPCVLFGLGGILAEALEQSVLRLAPLDLHEARAMIGAIAGQRLLGPWRGMPAVDRDALADLLVRLGELARHTPQIREIDLNPILFVHGQPKVADALLVV